MADNKLYVTAGLVTDDIPVTGDNKFYVTAGLIPTDLIQDMKGAAAGTSVLEASIEGVKFAKAAMVGTSVTGVIMNEYYRAMAPRMVFLYGDTRRKITED